MSANGSPGSGALSQKQPRILSCVLCQRRKIKCDRVIPCSNCIKAGVTCTPSKPAPPRQRSKPKQDLQQRLAHCEQLLRQYADESESGASTAAAAAAAGQSRLPAPSRSTPNHADDNSPGRIVLETGSTRFIDGQLWTTLNDEIQVMRDIIDSEYPDESLAAMGEDSPSQQGNESPVFPALADSDEKLLADPVHGIKLWQIFLDRVNPLIKIIHAPTVQPYVVQATADTSGVPLPYQALLSSIFGMASVSLSEDESMQTLGISRDQAVQKFTRCAMQALVRHEFLRRFNMTILQSLLFMLIILQSQYNRHAAWVLSGTVIRMAVSMGYHRDGETLNLSSFETEMRRRVWWQIVLFDMKLMLSCGFKHNSVPTDFDTKQPLNLNDADLYPDASGPLQSREGPTEMGFSLVSHRLAKYFLDEESRLTVEATILGKDNPQSTTNQQSRERQQFVVQSLDHDLQEIERRFLNPLAGNAHLAALGIRSRLIQQLNEMMLPMYEQPEWGTEIFGPKDNLFKVLLANGETIADAHSQMEHWGFSWFIRLDFHMEILASMTSLLYQRPTGQLSDRGWRILEQFYRYHTKLFNVSQKQYAVQAQYTLKAFSVREQAFAAAGHVLETPAFITQLRRDLQPAQEPQLPTPPQPFNNGFNHAMDQSGSNPFHGSFLTLNFWGGGMAGIPDMTDIGGVPGYQQPGP